MICISLQMYSVYTHKCTVFSDRVIRFFYTKTFLKTHSTWQGQKVVSVTRNDAVFGLGLTHALTTRQMSEVCEACSGLTLSATELCDVIHGRHESMTLSGR